MEQINDLKTDLEEKIDLSKSINLVLKVSKPKEKKLENLNSWNKNLNLKLKFIIKIEKLIKNCDTIYFSKKEKNLDLNTENKEDFLKKKLATTFFKIKNIDFKGKIKNNFSTKKEKNFLEENKKNQKENKNIFKDFFERKQTKWFKKNLISEKNFKLDYFKVAFVLALVLFLWLLDKIIVETLVKTSYTNLMSIKDNLSDLNKVKKTVSSSKTRLNFAEILFFPFSIIPNETVKNVNHLIDWGQNISKLLQKSISLYENTEKKIKENWWANKIYFSDLFWELRSNYKEISDLLVNTYIEYNKITDLWDKSLNEKLKSVKDKLNLALINLDKINKNYDTMLSILWEKKEKRYLVVFQNNDEIRATWGFIGSLAILDMQRWKIEKLEKKDVYALEWQINQIYKEKEKAPAWLNQITKTFWLRDANYFPEFKDSSAKIKFFLDKININLDWIIYVNQNVVLDLIDSIWWIYSKTFWTEITKENFSLIVSTLVEAEVFKEWTLWTPKKALFLFAEELFEKLNSEKKYYKYLRVFFEHIKTRDVVFYSFNPTENNFLWKLWLNWEINFKETIDFNFPIYTSIWWNKSDRYIDYRYEKTVTKIENSCDFWVNLKIFNTHTYSSENETKVKNILANYDNLGKNLEDIINIQWKWFNRSFLRVLVPKEASISLLDWQNITENEKYKIVNLYTLTKAWQTSNYDIKYRLNNIDCKNYSYKFFKQPWIKNYQILFDILWKKNEYNDIKTDFIYKD